MKAALETRLAPMDAEVSERTLTAHTAMDTSVSVTGKRGRTPADVAEHIDGPPQNQERRCRADDLCFAFVANKEVVKEHAPWRNPALKSSVGATHSSVAEGVGAATPAWVAEERNRALPWRGPL